MKLILLIASVPAYLMLASCANPSSSPMQQAMADGVRANAAMGLTPAGAPSRNAGTRPTGMQAFLTGRAQ